MTEWRRLLTAVVAVLLTASCDTFQESKAIEVENAWKGPIAVFIVEASVSHRLDPNPVWPRDQFESLKIDVRGTRTFAESEISGYQRSKNIVVYVYARSEDLGEPAERGYALLADIFGVSYAELIQRDFEVRIEDLSW